MSDGTPDQASHGVPAEGSADTGDKEPLGRPGLHHWRQSVITQPGLEERGNIFFAAVEMTRMPMILTDPNQPDNPIAFANNAFLDLTGYETEEIVGRNCRFLQGVGTDRETVRQIRDAVAARQAVAIEILNYRRDGSAFWNAVFIGPVFDPDGRLLYFFASQLDVTRRRESEQQFRQAQKMESIGQLTAGLAHDFNNLLHVVQGSLERLSARRDDPRVFDRSISAAMSAADRGAKLTRQLLAFARRSRLEPRAVNLTDLINSVSELLDTSVGSRAALRLDLRRRLPEVLVDPVHLEMALLNIVVNARDASPEGGEITVGTQMAHLAGDPAASVEAGDYVLLSVSDQGQGMPPHVLARAIEPFFTTKAAGEGTGLGLAMVHGFMQQSGGRLEIASEPGEGATIRMYFPVHRTAQPAAQDASSGYRPRAVSETAAPMILVVDDSPEIAALAEDTLVELGYRVVVAHSADEALRRFEEAKSEGGFQLLFSDVVMPGGANGLALAEEVRRRSPETPILMTTGYNDEMALDGPHPEAMDVIGKPYRRSDLVERVQAALRRGARTGPARQLSDFGPATA